jgi:uncharacterized protein YdaU (DUF1376 family)
MHYYQFNVGDYLKSTRHLSDIEDLAYRRLLDICYDTEKPLPKDIDKICRLIGLKNNPSETQAVLDDFFKLTHGGYIQKRVQKELKKYSVKADAARVNGKLGGRPKITQSVNSANPTLTQPKAKQEPLNNNHKPIKPCLFEVPDWVNKKAFDEFVQHRKEMNKPFSDLSKTKVCNKLKGFTDDEQQTAINTSIESRWAGVFPKKLNGNNYEAAKNNHSKPESNLARFSRKIQADIAAEDPFE